MNPIQYSIPHITLSRLLIALKSNFKSTICLDSGDGFGENSHYRITSAEPFIEFEVPANSQEAGDRLPEFCADLEAIVQAHRICSPGELPFVGGIVGYLAYDALNTQHKVKCKQPPADAIIKLGIYSWAVIENLSNGECYLIFHPACPTSLQQRVTNLLAELTTAENDDIHLPRFELVTPFSLSTSKESYLQAIASIQTYIQNGDCYQVNYSQQLQSRYIGDPLTAFLALRHHTNAPFSAYLNCGSHDILSFSPERFLLCEDSGLIETKPIKGTRPRGTTSQEDSDFKLELASSLKDRAENLMIVDLLRNDLGKFCETGSVSVPKLFEIETFSNVHHLVSTVSGKLSDQHTPLELLFGAFPGGSITGAPKKRAMEIINELEPHSRGPYCGSIFYYSFNGRMDSNIAIRTLLFKEGSAYCWGGGGIVADSDPESEYAESIIKIRNLISLLENQFLKN